MRASTPPWALSEYISNLNTVSYGYTRRAWTVLPKQFTKGVIWKHTHTHTHTDTTAHTHDLTRHTHTPKWLSVAETGLLIIVKTLMRPPAYIVQYYPLFFPSRYLHTASFNLQSFQAIQNRIHGQSPWQGPFLESRPMFTTRMSRPCRK